MPRKWQRSLVRGCSLRPRRPRIEGVEPADDAGQRVGQRGPVGGRDGQAEPLDTRWFPVAEHDLGLGRAAGAGVVYPCGPDAGFAGLATWERECAAQSGRCAA